MSKKRNEHLRSLLIKPFDELQQLEDSKELVLSFSPGICLLMQESSGAAPLLKAISEYKINRETDPFNDHSGGMFTYCQATIFFKISHQQQAAIIDIGLYSEIDQMRRQRNNYQWFALEAVIDF